MLRKMDTGNTIEEQRLSVRTGTKILISSCAALVFILVCNQVEAQRQEPGNIIPNAGFEEKRALPEKWYYRGSDFTRAVKFWSSPTEASPDYYGPEIRVPKFWRDRGFGNIQPFEGRRFVGLTMYGCVHGKPHCREYIQIHLSEALVVGQDYEFSFWTARLPGSLAIDRIGLYLSTIPVEMATDEILPSKPQWHLQEVLNIKPAIWQKISWKFTAKDRSEFLTLGNFFTDEQTRFIKTGRRGFDYAYYYFDDLHLTKLEPIIETSVRDNDLTRKTLVTGQVVELQNIYFDLDSDELLPISYVELNKLRFLFHYYPKLEVEIRGHTDSQGGWDYNIDLSKRRAEAVVKYLVKMGVNKKRIQSKGFGRAKPIDTNDTPEGRQKNRRVEFLVLKK